MKKQIAFALILAFTAFIAGGALGIWLATPDVIRGAPLGTRWARDLCTCEKNGITYLMPDIWHRGPDTE